MIRFTYMPELKWLIVSAALSAAAMVLSYTWAKGRANRWLRLAGWVAVAGDHGFGFVLARSGMD
jgi:hypothetical protein